MTGPRRLTWASFGELVRVQAAEMGLTRLTQVAKGWTQPRLRLPPVTAGNAHRQAGSQRRRRAA